MFTKTQKNLDLFLCMHDLPNYFWYSHCFKLNSKSCISRISRFFSTMLILFKSVKVLCKEWTKCMLFTEGHATDCIKSNYKKKFFRFNIMRATGGKCYLNAYPYFWLLNNLKVFSYMSEILFIFKTLFDFFSS